MDKVIDMSFRKGFKIVFKEPEVKEYIKNRAQLIIKREVKQGCFEIDPFGLCTILDCINCCNADVKIIRDDKVLKDFQSNTDNMKNEEYVIEFFDNFLDTDVVDYLNNLESDYRITRDSDKVILHFSKEDIKAKQFCKRKD